MGFSFGPSSLYPPERDAVLAFARAHGSRSEGPLDEAFWAAAGDPRTLEPQGMGSSYASGGAMATVLGSLSDSWLGMAEWREAGHHAPERLLVVPFGFWLDDRNPSTVAELSTEDEGRVVVVDPLQLLDHWPGHHDASYAERSAIAYKQLRASEGLEPESDQDWERLHLGAERWWWEIAQACWKARVPWAVAF